MRIKLTPAFIDKAPQPGKDRAFFWDEKLPGFGLMVTETGHRAYVLQYRVLGRSRRMNLGPAQSTNLDEMRLRAKALLGDVATGRLLRKPVDPLAERQRLEADETCKSTLRAVCEEFLKLEGRKLRSRDRMKAELERLIYPTFGKRPIGEIRKSEIVRFLDRVDEDNGPTMADAALAIMSRIMRWYQKRDDDFRSPIVAGLARSESGSRQRERTLNDEELRAVWMAAEADKGPLGAFVRFTLLTACRRNESARMRRAEVSGEVWKEAGSKPLGNVWVIPAARVKTGKKTGDHLVPLSVAAQRVLDELPRVGNGIYMFTFNGVSPMSGHAELKKRFDRACGVKGWTWHDLRRTARTLMGRARVDPDHAERCLNHVIGGQRGIYDRFDYLTEKWIVFEALASLVERIVYPPAENVVPLREAGNG
jgi:integrase